MNDICRHTTETHDATCAAPHHTTPPLTHTSHTHTPAEMSHKSIVVVSSTCSSVV